MQEQSNENGLTIEQESLPNAPVTYRIFLYFYDDDYIYIPGSEGWRDLPINIKESNATMQRPPAFYKARFNPQTQEWYESVTQEEITEILAKGRYGEPTESQLLGQQVTDLEIADIVKGQRDTDQEIALIIQGQQITDMELKILMMEAKLNV